MSKPIVHAESSARKFGGVATDYLDIHAYMDSSKQAIPSNIHRALTHNSWFVLNVLVRVFGEYITNSEGKLVSVQEVGFQHCEEDLGCVPTAQDYFESTTYEPWMHGQGRPPSFKSIERMKNKVQEIDETKLKSIESTLSNLQRILRD
jgi:hypothetical protein